MKVSAVVFDIAGVLRAGRNFALTLRDPRANVFAERGGAVASAPDFSR